VTNDPQTAESASNDDALEGDIPLDPEDAEQVKGGARFYCSSCSHYHFQGAPKCGPSCLHGGTSGGGVY
jgi:hypothetical protein